MHWAGGRARPGRRCPIAAGPPFACLQQQDRFRWQRSRPAALPHRLADTFPPASALSRCSPCVVGTSVSVDAMQIQRSSQHQHTAAPRYFYTHVAYPLYTHTYTHGGKEPGAKPAERREARQVRHTKVQTGSMSSRATQGEEAAEQKSETSCRQPYDRVGKQQPRLSPHLHLCPVPHCVSVGMHVTCHVYFFICQFAMPPTDPTEIDSRVRPVSRHMASEIMASG